jgi:hypothetical protein
MGKTIFNVIALCGYIGILFSIWGTGIYQKIGLSIFSFVVLSALLLIVQIKLDE